MNVENCFFNYQGLTIDMLNSTEKFVFCTYIHLHPFYIENQKLRIELLDFCVRTPYRVLCMIFNEGRGC